MSETAESHGRAHPPVLLPAFTTGARETAGFIAPLHPHSAQIGALLPHCSGGEHPAIQSLRGTRKRDVPIRAPRGRVSVGVILQGEKPW